MNISSPITVTHLTNDSFLIINSSSSTVDVDVAPMCLLFENRFACSSGKQVRLLNVELKKLNSRITLKHSSIVTALCIFRNEGGRQLRMARGDAKSDHCVAIG